MTENDSQRLTHSMREDQTIYYVVQDSEGIWLMREPPEDCDEILFQTTVLFDAERFMCAEIARCDGIGQPFSRL